MKFIVSYVGSPIIGLMVRFGKAPTTSALVRLIGACWGRGGVDGVRCVVASKGSGPWWLQRGQGIGKVSGVSDVVVLTGLKPWRR